MERSDLSKWDSMEQALGPGSAHFLPVPPRLSAWVERSWSVTPCTQKSSVFLGLASSGRFCKVPLLL